MNLSESFIKWAHRILPMPFTIAVLLTIVVMILALFLPESAYQIQRINDYRLFNILSFWEKGFWELLSFSMQMVLILVLGHVLALSKPISRIIDSIVSLSRSTASAAATVAFFSMLVAFLNWGLGLIFGAILARKVAEYATKNNIKLNYPLVGAAGYSGLMVWHGGFSGSAPLKVTETNHFLHDSIGIIPASETILSPMNLFTIIIILLIVPLFLYFLGKKVPSVKVNIATYEESKRLKKISGAERLDHNPFLGISFAILMLSYAIWAIFSGSKGTGTSFLQLNFINFMLFGLALLLHKNFKNFMMAFEEAVGGASGIIIQFPLYAGIMGIMKYSGMINEISILFIEISNETSLPIFTFISAGIVNVFVPSGGGQWAVQGPIITEAAKELGTSIPQNIMALAYGDQITNMIQPFWALPLLGITKLNAKDLLPFTFMIMLIGMLVFIGALLIF